MKRFNKKKYVKATDETINAMLKAAEHGKLDTIKEYIKAGFDPNVSHHNQKTMLHQATTNANIEIVQYLAALDDIDIDMKTVRFELTALHLATKMEHVEIIKVLLSHGADVNTRYRNGQMCINDAVLLCNETIVELFMQYKVDVNVYDVFSHTPLSIAILSTRNYSISKMLLDYGALPTLSRPYSLYLLYEAVLNYSDDSYLDILDLLCDNGANTNRIDEYGRNAMHYAAINGSRDLCSFLIAKLTAMDLQDMTRRTPYTIAVDHGNIGFARLLTRAQKYQFGGNVVEASSSTSGKSLNRFSPRPSNRRSSNIFLNVHNL